MKAFRNLNRFDAGRNFGPWIFTLARREAVSFHRRKRATLTWLWVKEPRRPDQISGEIDECAWIWALARETLNETAFSALWLSIEADASVRDIAQSLDKSETAAKVLLHRARKQLIDALRDADHPGLSAVPNPWKAVHNESN